MDVRGAGAAGEHLDLADELAGDDLRKAPRALDADGPFEDEVERVRRLAEAYHRLAVEERHLLAAREQRVEQRLWERREDARVVDDPLVLAAVEEERAALAVAGVLDLAEEQGVVAAPVRADDPRDEVREGAVDERRLTDGDEARLRQLLALAAREAVGETGLAVGEDADAVARPLVEHRAQPRLARERDEDEGRLQRHRHERVRRHPVHLIAAPGRQHGDAGREHPERTPERDRRVPASSPMSRASASGTSSNCVPPDRPAPVVSGTSNSSGSGGTATSRFSHRAGRPRAAGALPCRG